MMMMDEYSQTVLQIMPYVSEKEKLAITKFAIDVLSLKPERRKEYLEEHPIYEKESE